MTTDTLKCGRKTYELVDGDTVLDNGCTLQLTSRKINNGFYSYPPRVPKAEFKRFKAMPNVELQERENEVHLRSSLWRYTV